MDTIDDRFSEFNVVVREGADIKPEYFIQGKVKTRWEPITKDGSTRYFENPEDIAAYIVEHYMDVNYITQPDNFKFTEGTKIEVTSENPKDLDFRERDSTYGRQNRFRIEIGQGKSIRYRAMENEEALGLGNSIEKYLNAAIEEAEEKPAK